MAIFSYRTIRLQAEGIYKEKGSKFIAIAIPVETESAIKEKLDEVRKKYFDARHHCYAYVLGADKKKFRAFDDGEPNHSAGDPILGQIRSKDLTNILLVVVRYFGGTKLGVGGLVSAYKAASEDCLNKAIIVEQEVLKVISLQYEYSSSAEVMKLIKDFDLEVVDQTFLDRCSLTSKVKVRKEEALLEKLNYLKAIGHGLTFTEENATP